MSFLESSCPALGFDRFFETEEFVENTASEAPPDTFTGIEFGLFPSEHKNEDLKVIISKQPLDAWDIVTIGLVGVANAGVIAKGIKSGIGNLALEGFAGRLGDRIGLIGKDAAAVGKIQKELGKIKLGTKSRETADTILAEPIETTLHRLKKIGLSEEGLKAAKEGAIKTRGFSDEFAEELAKSKIINKISDVKIDNRLTTAPLATKIIRNSDGTTTYELIVGRGGMDNLKPYLRFALEHEYSEILKDELRIQGKIASESKLVDMVFDLKITTKSKQELYDLIEHRVFADKIALKARPELLGEWKIESKKLLNKVDEWYNYGLPRDDIHDLLPNLAYLKNLNPQDAVLMQKVNTIIKNLDTDLKEEFTQISDLLREVTKNA